MSSGSRQQGRRQDVYSPTSPTRSSTHRSRRSSQHPRHHRTQSQSADPGPGSSSQNTNNLRVESPPVPGAPSPATEAALLPGGGIEVPPGFHFNEADQGLYRPRSRDVERGEPDPSQFARRGFSFFKGLRKIPAAIVKAGRSYGPRERSPTPSFPEPEIYPRQQESERLPVQKPMPDLPIQDEPDTYLEEEEEEEDYPAREEQILQEYNRRRRIRRDRTFTGSTRRRTAPTPQPVPVPGSRTPGASQAGGSNILPATLEARLEAEEQRQESEALRQAQELERARNIYASEAVKQPSTVTSTEPQYMTQVSMASHGRGTSVPRLSNRVYSRWSAERDSAGRRRENRDIEDTSVSSSPISSIARFFRVIRDMPWVGDRVAADYIPGGVKPPSPSRYYVTSPGSDTTFSSPYFPSEVLQDQGSNGPPLQGHKHGRSWYTAPRDEDEIIVLPVGVEPPPGFLPFPYEDPEPPQPTTAQPEAQAGPAPNSASSHTHVDSHLPTNIPSALLPAGGAPHPGAPQHPSAPGSTVPGMNGSAIHYMPAAASTTGQPFYFTTTNDGRQQPVFIPGLGQQPAYIYSYPGPPRFSPKPRSPRPR